jgi:carboxypeptidase Q
MKPLSSAKFAFAIGALAALVFAACQATKESATLASPKAFASASSKPAAAAPAAVPADRSDQPAPAVPAAPVTIAQEAARPAAEATPAAGAAVEERTTSSDPIERIKDEGLNHSQAMETLSYLSDVIGPRLTGSPNLKRANEWTKMKLESWGLTNAHLESWGPFGRGWEVKRFSAQVIEPQDFPIIAYPLAWSPGYDKPMVGDAVYIDLAKTTNLDQYKGKVEGAMVLISPMRTNLAVPLQPLAVRLADSNLLVAANTVDDLGFFGMVQSRGGGGGGRRGGFGSQLGANRISPARLLSFLTEEKAGVVLSASSQFDNGTVLVQSASVPAGTNAGGGGGFGGGRGGGSAYSTNAPAMPPQVAVAAESYNRIVRMIKAGEKVKMQIDLEVKYHDEDLMAYNTIAEIPGTDLKDEIVMLGGHMDSWPAGTGATDNGVGVAACMEAVRIIQAAGLHPRRTIRIALWSGEEEGLLGSRAYVSQHFGSNAGRGGGGGGGRGGRGGRGGSGGLGAPGTNAPGELAANANNPPAQSDAIAGSVTSINSPAQSAGRGGGGGRAGQGRQSGQVGAISFGLTGQTNITTGQGRRGGQVGASQEGTNATPEVAGASTNAPARRGFTPGPEYDKLSAYFNLDNGGGKIRGIFMEQNEAVRPIFRRWMEPFRSLGAETLSMSRTGSTDHVSFDSIGLPGFQFLQDPMDYFTHTHHTSEDVFDRISAEDLKQAATVMAAFVYDAAMMDEKLPRSPRN